MVTMQDIAQSIKNNKLFTPLILGMFIIYLSILSYLLFFGYYRQMVRIESYNLVPFKTIKMYIIFADYFQFKIWFSNLFGNILAFMPFGFLLPIVFKRLRNLLIVTSLSFLFSLFVETMQLTFHVGGFDVDDILLNTIGGFFGYILFKLLYILFKKPVS